MPEGTQAATYTNHGPALTQTQGLPIADDSFAGPRVLEYQPGESIPNYVLKTPDNLTVVGNSVTVDATTSIRSCCNPTWGMPLGGMNECEVRWPRSPISVYEYGPAEAGMTLLNVGRLGLHVEWLRGTVPIEALRSMIELAWPRSRTA